MSKYVYTYLNAVKKKMLCSGAEKKQILSAFAQNVERYEEENESADLQHLCENFGSPEEMAAELMKDITPEQQNAYRKKKTVLRVIAGVLVAVLAAAAIYIFFIKQKPIMAYEEIIDWGDVKPGSSQSAQGGE